MVTADRPELSKLCFGCEPLGGMDWGAVDVPEIEAAIDLALDLGIDFFDTADVYGLGRSETRLAAALGSRRHDVIIATKGGHRWSDGDGTQRASVTRDASPGHLRAAVEDSLRRLRLERIPIYFVHWPPPGTEIHRTFEFLMRLRAEDKIGLIGCSNFSADQLRAACEVADVSLLQVPVNVLGEDLSADLQRVLEAHDVGVVAYNTLAYGLLTGQYNENSRFGPDDRRSRLPLFQGDRYSRALTRVAAIGSWAAERGMTTAQGAIAEILNRSYVVSVILGIKNRAQLKENHGALEHARKLAIQGSSWC